MYSALLKEKRNLNCRVSFILGPMCIAAKGISSVHSFSLDKNMKALGTEI